MSGGIFVSGCWTGIGRPSFLYLFDHGYPAADQAGIHAFHASELPFMFGTLDRTPPRWPKIPTTPQESRLSNAMVGYWTSFARAGRPQGRSRASVRTSLMRILLAASALLMAATPHARTSSTSPHQPMRSLYSSASALKPLSLCAESIANSKFASINKRLAARMPRCSAAF